MKVESLELDDSTDEQILMEGEAVSLFHSNISIS